MRELSFNLERAIAPQPIVLEPLTATENGTYTPALGVNGYNSVEVAVPIPPAPVLTTLSVSENGTYEPEQGVDGFSKVEVEVPIPEAKVRFEGDIHDAFENPDVWNAVKDKCEFGIITRMDSAWTMNTAVEYIPPIHFGSQLQWSMLGTFTYTFLREVPQFVIENMVGYITTHDVGFLGCNYLETADLTGLKPDSQQKLDYMFGQCWRLRSYDTNFVSQIEAGGSEDIYGGFEACHSLDEIKDYPYIKTGTAFISDAYRIKSFTYKDFGAAQRIGNITIRLDNKFYVKNRDAFLKNTDFTTDTEITDAASYALLKNNPDQWSADIAYSRYNRVAAAETINSLPTNIFLSPVIQFSGNSGSGTDGGAISTLTPEELAVATTKGWTVSYV